jgi:hypothetical protein
VKAVSAKTEKLTPVQLPEIGESEVSFSVDVLESTNFSQFTDSGITNP